MLVKGEGLIRLEAERRLLKHYAAEYERLARGHGHVEALRRLVDAHKARYNEVTRQAREDRGRYRAITPERQRAPAA